MYLNLYLDPLCGFTITAFGKHICVKKSAHISTHLFYVKTYPLPMLITTYLCQRKCFPFNCETFTLNKSLFLDAVRLVVDSLLNTLYFFVCFKNVRLCAWRKRCGRCSATDRMRPKKKQFGSKCLSRQVVEARPPLNVIRA